MKPFNGGVMVTATKRKTPSRTLDSEKIGMKLGEAGSQDRGWQLVAAGMEPRAGVSESGLRAVELVATEDDHPKPSPATSGAAVELAKTELEGWDDAGGQSWLGVRELGMSAEGREGAEGELEDRETTRSWAYCRESRLVAVGLDLCIGAKSGGRVRSFHSKKAKEKLEVAGTTSGRSQGFETTEQRMELGPAP